jgi:hypothetical protein
VTVRELGQATAVKAVPTPVAEMGYLRGLLAPSGPMPGGSQAAPLRHTRRNCTRPCAQELTSLQDLAARVNNSLQNLDSDNL